MHYLVTDHLLPVKSFVNIIIFLKVALFHVFQIFKGKQKKGVHCSLILGIK